MDLQKTNIFKSVVRTLELESEAIRNLIQRLSSDVESVVSLIYDSKHRVLVTGIGKSAIIGQKIVATFNSTGTASHFLHASDAVHGDLGMIGKNDLIVCISNSGNTPEIKRLIRVIKERQNTLIALVGNEQSYLYQEADYKILTSVNQEAGPHNLAPTSSTTAQLAMGDAIAVAVLELRQFSSEDFARLHPGGTLGKKLLAKVEDFVKLNPAPKVSASDPIKKVIVEISSKRLGATIVLDEQQNILGIITDGDIRRMLQKHDSLEGLVARDIMSPGPKTIEQDQLATAAVSALNQYKINQIVVTKQGEYMGLVHLHDLVREGLT